MKMLQVLAAFALVFGLGYVTAAQKYTRVVNASWIAIGDKAAIAVSGFTTLDKKPAVRGTLMVKVDETWHPVEWEPRESAEIRPVRE